MKLKSRSWLLGGALGVGLIAQLFLPGVSRAQSMGSAPSPLPDQSLQAAAPAAVAPSVRVLSFNDLGMHCYDSDFSVFAILPLFNVLHAQVIQIGAKPVFLDNTAVKVRYKAMVDPHPGGSINRTSRGKTNFWRYMKPLFGIARPVDVGILGAKMPGLTNIPQPFSAYDATMNWFSAEGIPITGYDDKKQRNSFSLMSVQAVNTAGKLLAQTPTVVPASDEMNCSNCHMTGEAAADPVKYPTIPWNKSLNPAIQTKVNILLLHDFKNATTLNKSRPVLCASCHYSKALDLQNQGPQNTLPYLSHAVHGFHASLIPQDTTTTDTCFNCHPGPTTQCLRGVMASAGIVCTNCHGSMTALGNPSRQPWAEEPKCQSCHTGDEMNHKGTSVRFKVAYTGSINVATPRIATNQRFAENANTLYRFSLGHNGVACEACHGSPHAEWSSSEANDDMDSESSQGHAGPLIECKACHGAGLTTTTLSGPHGMHNVNSAVWYDGGHEKYYESNPAQCKACHGTTLNGSELGLAAANRSFTVEGQSVSVAQGTKITCTLCHSRP